MRQQVNVKQTEPREERKGRALLCKKLSLQEIALVKGAFPFFVLLLMDAVRENGQGLQCPTMAWRRQNETANRPFSSALVELECNQKQC